MVVETNRIFDNAMHDFGCPDSAGVHAGPVSAQFPAPGVLRQKIQITQSLFEEPSNSEWLALFLHSLLVQFGFVQLLEQRDVFGLQTWLSEKVVQQ